MEATETLNQALDQVGREHVLATLRKTKGNKREAAKLLGVSRGTLYRRLKEYGLTHLVRQPLDGL